MRKTVTILMFLLVSVAAYAQNCTFKVKFTVTPASCYNNGKVAYALFDTNGNVVANTSALAALGLEQVRIYYKNNVDDTAHHGNFYTGGWDTLIINYGEYIIGVEGLCGLSIVDTNTVLNVPTTYKRPEAVSFSNIATTAYDRLTSVGMRPTIECFPTGVVQMKILYGAFPYTVTIKNQADGSTLRTDVFTERQYTGSDSNYYNYRDYYSFSELPEGVWQFYIVDGCDYHLPVHTQHVELVEHPKFYSCRSDYYSFLTVPGSDTSYMDKENDIAVSISMELNNNNNDYRSNRFLYNGQYLPRISQYRFNYGNGRYTNWKPSPTGARYVYPSDTSSNIKLCDLLGKTVYVEYKDVCSNRIDTCSYTVPQLIVGTSNPKKRLYTDSTNVNTACYQRNGYTNKDHYHSINARFNSNYSIRNTALFFEKPLVWVWTDTATGNVILRDTIKNLLDVSALYDTTVERIYGSFETTPCTLGVKRELVSDVCGVLITNYQRLIYTTYDYNNQTFATWSSNYGNSTGNCVTIPHRWVWVYSSNYSPSLMDYDSTIVRLVESPISNFYNFEAIYDARTKTLRNVVRANPANTASIYLGSSLNETGEGTYFRIQSPNLVPGFYKWQIITPCDTYDIVCNATSFNTNNRYETYWVEEPEYTTTKDCTRGYITYTAGKVGFNFINISPNTGQDTVVSTYIPPTTCFKIISGPAGGWDQSTGRFYKVGEPIPVSVVGKYIIQVFYTAQTASPITEGLTNYFCRQYYDTIDFNLATTVDFEYAIALLCGPTSTEGDVYVKGIDGTPPYTYTLYSQADLQGTVLGTNNNGRFTNTAFRTTDVLSCKIVDQCGAQFPVNITPKVWSRLQKVWFDNGLTVQTSCEGDSICVNALVLGDILTYEWRGPDGFSSTEATNCLFLPRGATPGYYGVYIRSQNCHPNYYEAIELKIKEAPNIKLGSDMNVCQGEPTELIFIPQSSNTTENMNFTMVFESLFSKTSRSFNGAPGDTVRYTIYPETDTKVYVYSIGDGSCTYNFADDTLYVNIKQNPPFTINSADDHICYDATALLKASSSLTPPYIIRWYNDYNLSNLVKADTVTASAASSELVLPNLKEDKTYWITVAKDNFCPPIYGRPSRIVNMTDGATTQLSLGQTYRFYDGGGPNAYHIPAVGTITHTFKSTDGKPVTLRFDNRSIYYSNIYVFSGTTTNTDSLLTEVNSSINPGTITSRGDALTVQFLSNYSYNNFSAYVEHEPAKAVATVRKVNSITLYDTVCQSQTKTYTDRYGVVPSVATQDTLNKSIRKYGIYSFTKTLTSADVSGCDSTVTFNLIVTKPASYDTTVVISNFTHPNGYLWNGRRYKDAGEYYKYTTLAGGCDSVDILNLVVLKIDTLDKEICLGDTTDLTITVTVEGSATGGSSHNTKVYVGDVLCSDGSTMNVDDFMTSGKTAIGVVTHVDAAGGFGRAIALSGAKNKNNNNSVTMKWCGSGYTYINSLTQTDLIAIAGADMNGPENTVNIVAGARAKGTLNEAAAYHCMYYDPSTFTTGTDSTAWYMPSLGEMQLIYASRIALNNTLSQLQTTNSNIMPLQQGTYWTSTEYNDPGFDYAWTMENAKLVGKDKYGYYYVRPMIRFTLP